MGEIQRSAVLLVFFAVVDRGDCSAWHRRLYYEGTLLHLECLVSILHGVCGFALDVRQCISSSSFLPLSLSCSPAEFSITYPLYTLIYSLSGSPHFSTHPSFSVYPYSIIQSALYFSLCVCNQAPLYASVILTYIMSAAAH